MNELAVEFDNFYWSYPTFTGAKSNFKLKNINLKIYKNEFFGITGATGSGKTTLCYAIAGLIPYQIKIPSEKLNDHMKGSVRVFGETVSQIIKKDERFIVAGKGSMAPVVGLIMQDPESQFLTMSALSELSLGLQIMGISKEEMEKRIKNALEMVGLEHLYPIADKIHPSELSGGQKQRLMIASFLAMNPKILILDEPTSDLDPSGKLEVIEAIAKLKESGDITVVLVEHDPEVLRKFATRMAVVHDGEIIITDAPENIYSNELVKKYIDIPEIMTLIGNEEEIISKLDVNVVRDFKIKREDKQLIEPAIEVKDLYFSYSDGTRAINGIDLTVKKGEFIALIGQNGSGKSTLSKILSGYETKVNGSVKILGMDISKKKIREEIPKYVGYVFQNPDHQIFNRSVKSEIAYGLRNIEIVEKKIEAIVNETLKRVGLESKKDEDPLFLSRGQKRRLAVACVMAMHPAVLIVDEPTTGQDYKMSKEIMELLNELNLEGTTIIVITHDMRLVAEYCRRIVVMKQGKITFEGLPEVLFADEKMLKESSLIAPQSVRVSKKLREAGIIRDLLLNAKEWLEFFRFEEEKKKFIFLSYEMLNSYAKRLAEQLIEKYGRPEAIIFIERGGMIIGRILSDFLGVKELYGIRASYYLDDGTPSTHVSIGDFPYRFADSPGYLLLVDDIADSGKTLDTVLNKLRAITSKKIVTCTVAFKPQSVIKPDAYAYTVDNETWIVFDYERKETRERFVRKDNKLGLKFMEEHFLN